MLRVANALNRQVRDATEAEELERRSKARQERRDVRRGERQEAGAAFRAWRETVRKTRAWRQTPEWRAREAGRRREAQLQHREHVRKASQMAFWMIQGFLVILLSALTFAPTAGTAMAEGFGIGIAWIVIVDGPLLAGRYIYRRVRH